MGKNFIKRFVSGLVAAAVVATSLPITERIASAATRPEGFVYAEDGKFMCDGSTYYYGGTNCYYLTYKSDSEVERVFDDAQDMGLKVIRLWGHLDVGKKTGATTFEGNNDGVGEKDGIYFQYWDDKLKKPVVNEGADGLQRLDYIIKQAEDHDMKLIITFTNYWEAFGGMGQYVKWLQMKNGESVSSGAVSGSDCCQFYTDNTLKGWYKDYIKTLLNHTNHYTGEKLMNSEAVFAWELSNEPRCPADERCTNNTLYNWAKEMSAYVKSIDPNHMVSVGDEGFFNWKYEEATAKDRNHYVYAGAEGTDFAKLMSIDTVDFGTPHMYMEDWGVSNENGDVNWINDHAEVAVAVNKPVIMEEFGDKDKSARDANMKKWLDLFVNKYQGFNYWMIASYLDNGQLYQDYDGYTVYGPTGTATDSTRKLIVNAAAEMSKKNNQNSTDKSEYAYDRSAGKDVTIKVTAKLGGISGLEFNGKTLTKNTDYTVSGTTITLKDAFLKKQDLSAYDAKVIMSAGNSPKFKVMVTDPNMPQPTITPTDASVDINPKVCEDVIVEMDKKTSEFRGILFNNKKLTEGSDYTVNGDVVIISASFLSTLPTSTNKLVFDFYEGEDCTLNIAVTNTTGADEFDTFENYRDDSALSSAYTKNTSGNDVTLKLVNRNGSNKLSFTYKVDNPDYCGVDHPMTVKNMSAFDGIEFEIEGDGSGNSFTLQLKDANDKYYEKVFTIDFTDVKTIKVPFEEFVAPTWQSGGGKLDSSKINQFSIYAGSSGSKTTGTYYIDDIVAYSNKVPVEKDAYIIGATKTYDRTASDVKVNLVLNGKTLKSVSYNGKALVKGTDYTVNSTGNQVTIGEKYLAALTDGQHKFVFKFSNDKEAVLNLTVTTKAKVANLKAAPSKDSVKLTWDKNALASYYKVFVWKDNKWTKLTQTTNNTTVSYTAKSLAANTSYKFRVSAYNKSGTAIAYSDVTSKTKGNIANLKAAPAKNSVKLTWSKNTSASYYKVFVWKDNKWNKLTQTKDNNVLNYTVKSLSANTSYKYRVSGYDKNGKEFAYSDVTVKTKGGVANLKAAPAKNSVKLTWSKNASAIYYKVFVWKDNKWNKLTQTKDNNVLNYTVKSLSANTSYKYRVSGYDKNGKEFAYSDVTVKTKGNIANLKAAPTNSSVKLTWSKNTSASYYKVFVWKDNKWNKLTQTKDNNVLNYTVKSLSANTSYKYRVSGYDKNGKEFAYSDVTVKTKGNIANLKAAPAKNSVKLTWSKNASASYYKVFVWKDNKWNKLTQTKDNNVLNYTVKSLSANTSYKYRVSGYDKNGKEFAYSDVTVKTKGNIANLKAAPTNNSVKLTWSKNASASYYKVFVWKDNKWTKLTQTTNNTTVSYTAKSLAANTSYKFRVSGYDKNGKEFAYSDVTVKTKGKIANLKAAPAKNSAKLTWSKNASASYYKVFYWNNGKWNKITQTNNNAKVSCNIINLKSATSYKFRVSGYDKNGKEFAYSDITTKTKR